VRLTVEEHPQAIKRYAHLKRARRFGMRVCYAACPSSGRTCSRESGHRGPHASHGWFSQLLAVWDCASEHRARPSAPRRRAEVRRGKATTGARHRELGRQRPTGLKNRDAPSLPGRVLHALLRFLKSPDEVAFVFLFVVFIYWGIQWMVMILQ